MKKEELEKLKEVLYEILGANDSGCWDSENMDSIRHKIAELNY